LLAGLYVAYIVLVCLFRPEKGPALPPEQRKQGTAKKLWLVLTSMLPTLILIFTVLGTIFFGVAAPTEAAAIGALASIILALCYGNLDLETLKEAFFQTGTISSMILLIVAAAFVFTGTFMLVGGGFVLKEALFNLPLGPWGIFAIMIASFFVFGLFMEWVGIVPILVPIFTPIIDQLGFDPLWAAMIFCVAMQTSFLTPPMAPALFYLKGVAPTRINFARHIVQGALPFIAIQLIGLTLLGLFPALVLWLPSLMD
jgi:tripartite ATP-independent transporter DctM subunit